MAPQPRKDRVVRIGVTLFHVPAAVLRVVLKGLLKTVWLAPLHRGKVTNAKLEFEATKVAKALKEQG